MRGKARTGGAWVVMAPDFEEKDYGDRITVTGITVTVHLIDLP